MFQTETIGTAPQPQQPARAAYPFRLLPGETVLGTFPVARKQRPLGKLASFLFVTDSRLIYSAEAKTVSSSSTHLKEFQIGSVQGLEVGRHTGLGPTGMMAAIGGGLNFVILFGLAGIASTFSTDGFIGGDYHPFASYTPVFALLAFMTAIVSGLMIAILRAPKARLAVMVPGKPDNLAKNFDLVKALLVALLFIVFGALAGLALIVMAIVRELGIFQADDGQLYADPASMDRIAFDAGALIIDVQARGTFADRI